MTQVFRSSGPFRVSLPAWPAPGSIYTIRGNGQVLSNIVTLPHPIDQRCEAITSRHTRCRRPVSGVIFVAGQPGQHSACKTHLKAQRGWW